MLRYGERFVFQSLATKWLPLESFLKYFSVFNMIVRHSKKLELVVCVIVDNHYIITAMS